MYGSVYSGCICPVQRTEKRSLLMDGSGEPLHHWKFTVGSTRVSVKLAKLSVLKYWPVNPVPVLLTVGVKLGSVVAVGGMVGVLLGVRVLVGVGLNGTVAVAVLVLVAVFVGV